MLDKFPKIRGDGLGQIGLQAVERNHDYRPRYARPYVEGKQLASSVAAEAEKAGQEFFNRVRFVKLHDLLCGPNLEPARLDAQLALAPIAVAQENEIVLRQL